MEHKGIRSYLTIPGKGNKEKSWSHKVVQSCLYRTNRFKHSNDAEVVSLRDMVIYHTVKS